MKNRPNSEGIRLEECRMRAQPWKKWGPYLSERQWGTVREDYSENGAAWDYFTHDHSRSRAYRWGEDGIAGISDEKQRLCFSVAFWNGADPILKERLFGLTNSEGNHGEDVKEYYFYLDSTPTHSYMKYLYKYPQVAFPYLDLVHTNREKSRHEPEYELIDTGAFDEDRYFDIFIEYAKADPNDIAIRIKAFNRGPEIKPLDIIPTLWFRNTWSWGADTGKPSLSARAATTIQASHAELGDFFLYSDAAFTPLFTENETNAERIFKTPNPTPYVKDGINNYIVSGQTECVNPVRTGTKAGLHYHFDIPAHGSVEIRLRLTPHAPAVSFEPFGAGFEDMFAARKQEADEFYQSVIPDAAPEDQRLVMRQALAGMLWSKQYYYFDLDRWLREHGYNPGNPYLNRHLRNAQWFHMVNDDVISMPDKWEYPWYAAWDLAFHTVAIGIVDIDFAKEQLDLMLRDVYLHPNGQLPAYEWNFSDVNPPVHAWALLYLFNLEREQRGTGDFVFLENAFRKLLLNFTWWVNRKDRSGSNVFEGGFLGLDNIGVFDRSAPLPTGGRLEQADGTAWMAIYCQSMLSIAMELTEHDPTYEHMAQKFVEHYLWIAGSMDRVGVHQDELWDEEDGFFYDVLYLPDGDAMRLQVRSMVGLLPLAAVSILPESFIRKYPSIMDRVNDFFKRRPELAYGLHPPNDPGVDGRHLLSVLNEENLRRVLQRMLDEDRFLSPHGIRALSKWHLDHPYVFNVHGEDYRVQYEAAESSTGLFGGNSNWRGPVWFPVNILLVKSLVVLYEYYGDRFQIECPTGSGKMMNLFEVAGEISNRLIGIFTKDRHGRRPVFGATEKFQTDPHWQDYLLFYEYFHGDNGAGIGANHQTGWTGLVARLIQARRGVSSEHVLSGSAAESITVVSGQHSA
jgi:Mannosylglycerate hydrolase MGH1-like glycoside hydrolase domain